MISFGKGSVRLTCSNCGERSPAADDYYSMAMLAIESGWISLTNEIEGCVSVDHFCPKCHTAAGEFWERYISNYPDDEHETRRD